MRNKIFWSVILVLGLVVPAAAQGWAVKPGEGVGPLLLGMTPDQAAAHLNQIEVIGSPRNPRYVRYGAQKGTEEVLIEYMAGKAVMISLHQGQIQTKAGPVKWIPVSGGTVGAAWNTVEGALGRGYKREALKVGSKQPPEDYYAYTSKGLGFRTRAGTIVQVDVWQAR